MVRIKRFWGDRRTARGTWVGFQSPKTFGEVGKEVLGEEWQEGGPSLLLLPTARRSVDWSGRVFKNRPNHVQKVLGTIPVLSDNKEKTRLAASSTPRYPQNNNFIHVECPCGLVVKCKCIISLHLSCPLPPKPAGFGE